MGASGSLQKTKAQQRKEIKALERYMKERDEAKKAKGDISEEDEEISEEENEDDFNEEEIEFKEEIEGDDDQMEEVITPNELEEETGEELKFDEEEEDEEEEEEKKPKKKKTNKPIDEREFIRRALNRKFKKKKGFKGGKNKNKGKTKVGDFM